jgi:hypothetical protein
MGLFNVTSIMGFNETLKKPSYLTERGHFKDTDVVGSIILK